MASRTIFPPIVNSYEPAFVAGSGSSLKVYFSLSNLSSIPDGAKLTVHAQIFRQDGVKVVNTNNDTVSGRYRATGTILNLVPKKSNLGDNYYYITIENSDLKSSVTLSGTTYTGWIPGWIYKIQLRLSTVTYDPVAYPKQEAWLQEFSNSFSEWSTICYTKAISTMALQIPLFDYDNTDNTSTYDPDTIYTLTKVNLFGSLYSSIHEANEYFKYVRISLYYNDNLIEDSGEINKAEQSDSYFEYNFKTNFIEGSQYKILLNYMTENEYVPSKPIEFNFVLAVGGQDIFDGNLVTLENDIDGVLENLTFLEEEEDEGRLALKITSINTNPWSGNICIRRASQDDNFQSWEDIKILVVKEKNLNELDLIYDYTIQSGVWYKYGIQSIDSNGDRSKLNEISSPVMRLFNFSYLLGQDDVQLKLQFDNAMDSFKYQMVEGKTEPVGSKYPFINRNGTIRYRVFPVNGLISFWMDENNTFLKNGKASLYYSQTIANLYDKYLEETEQNNRTQYDYTLERDFREAVLRFLQDGKPKLFKSPSEGNVIVSLINVTCNPKNELGRLIYSFSCEANETDDNTMANYLKYGFYNPGQYGTDFSEVTVQLGQLAGTFTPTDNIFKLIYEKYDSQGNNYGGYSRKLKQIDRVTITINGYYMGEQYINGAGMRIRNNANELVIGNNISLSYSGGKETSLITIYGNVGTYEFDSLLSFFYTGSALGNDSLYLLGDAEGLVTAIDATVDFLYSISSEPYKEHEIAERKAVYNIGQFFGEVTPDTSIYNLIYYQHYVDSDTTFKYLNSLSSIEIEADPHTVFAIKDASDSEPQYHEINETGVLNLEDIENITYLTYIGRRYMTTPYDENTVSSDIITTDIRDERGFIKVKAAADVSVTYRYTDIQGVYRVE